MSPAPSRVTSWQFDQRDNLDGARWSCTTRHQAYWDTPYERRMGPTARQDKVTAKGLLVAFDRPGSGEVRVATNEGTFSFDPAARLWSAPRTFLDGRVEVRSAPIATRLTSGAEAQDYPALYQAGDGTMWLAYQTWTGGGGDQIMVRRRAQGNWSAPEALTPPGGDHYRTAIAEDSAGKLWVVWASQVSSNFDLYGRAFDGRHWSPAERLTTASGSDIFHSLIRDNEGNLYLAWQSSRDGNFDIYLRVHGGGKWSGEIQVSSDTANDWEPVLAAAPDGRVTVIWDTYAKGSYDVVARTLRDGKLGPLTEIAATGAFESRASAQYDGQGRLWVAWDEGDWNWGKDYGNLIPESGRGLLVRRQARVAVLANGRLLEPKTPIAEAVPEDLRQVFHQPRLVLDGSGAPWVFFRYRVNLPRDQGREVYRALWRFGATSYRDGRWIPLIEFPEGFGRMDSPASIIASDSGDLEAAWVTDGRTWPDGFPQQQNLYLASIPSASSSSEVELVALRSSPERFPSSHPNEAAAVARVRDYRAEAGGEKLRIVRGDIHRHTDISWDGNRDGSLNDGYRYALDAAAMDFIGVCDHQGGQSIPYHWWMIEKAVDLFTIENRFAPFYSYERSLSYPNGHRNVLFATRGRPILEIPEPERRGEEGAGKLYEYLRRLGGITTSHTSATGAGTDWRDSDEELEPIVEIYQGYRNNFEGPDVPRRVEGAAAERFKAGFVQNAWEKGIKMGVQASSDHVSTHISYAAFYVDRLDREAILQAARARRSYAATDNVLIDFRIGDHILGESFRASSSQPIKAFVAGTGPIETVTLVKNNRVIYTAPGTGATMEFHYTDQDIEPGESFYYVRIQQKNGQLGWSSPIWVTYEP